MLESKRVSRCFDGAIIIFMSSISMAIKYFARHDIYFHSFFFLDWFSRRNKKGRSFNSTTSPHQSVHRGGRTLNSCVVDRSREKKKQCLPVGTVDEDVSV